MSGLLIDGKLVSVDGLVIIPPASHGGPSYAQLDPGDYRRRETEWIRQLTLHSTSGRYPQPIRPGAGKFGHAQLIADMWRGVDRGGEGKRIHAGAHLLVDFDGTVVCLVDLQHAATYHAEACNDWSVGVEMCTRSDGSIYEATLDTTATLAQALCRLLGIPEQYPRGPYRNTPLRRMETGSGELRKQLGGPALVGVIGHRDCTERRGRGDPGDAIWQRLAALNFESLDYEGGEDLLVGRQRQRTLNRIDDERGNTNRRLVLDGVIGPGSMRTMKRLAFTRWQDVPG